MRYTRRPQLHRQFGPAQRLTRSANARSRYRAAVPRVLPDLSSDYDVPAERIDEFGREGHTVLRNVCTSDEVAVYRPVIEAATRKHTTETRPLEARDTYSKAFLQVTNLWVHDDGVRRFVTARRFAKIAAELMGVEGVRLYHDQALFKEAGGAHTPWHQDQFYWPFDTEKTITMWMPLADLDPVVGSMTFATGSHRAGKLRGHAISDASEAEFARLVRDEQLSEHTPLPRTHRDLHQRYRRSHVGTAWSRRRAACGRVGSLLRIAYLRRRSRM